MDGSIAAAVEISPPNRNNHHESDDSFVDESIAAAVEVQPSLRQQDFVDEGSSLSFAEPGGGSGESLLFENEHELLQLSEPMSVSDVRHTSSLTAYDRKQTIQFSEHTTDSSGMLSNPPMVSVPSRNEMELMTARAALGENFEAADLREEELDDYRTFPKDCYSFIALYSGFPLFYGLVVFFFQFAFLYLMIYIRWEDANENNDNPDDGIVASVVPSNVSNTIRITQILALVAFILFADHSLNAVVKAVELFPFVCSEEEKSTMEGRQRIYRARLSCFLRFVQGAMACLTTLLLVMSSKDGIEIILNFAAVNFISNFDHQAFELAKEGRYGIELQRKAEDIQNCPIDHESTSNNKRRRTVHHLPRSMKRSGKRRLLWYWGTVGVIALVFLAFIVAIVVRQERNDVWTTELFRVQFGEEDLEKYNGCYYRGEKSSNHQRRLTYERKRNSQDTLETNTTIRYCEEERRWVLYNYMSETDSDKTDPCNAYQYTNDVAHSSETNSYGITDAFETPWFSPWDKPLDVYFIESNVNNEYDFFCESFPGNGICDVDLNRFEYQYDGGDCCPMTCSKPELCGKGVLRFAFGELVRADGFPNCMDPDAVEVTTYLDFLNILEIPEWATSDYFDYNEWANLWRPKVELECGGTKVYSTPLRPTMRGRSHTAKVDKGSFCTLFVDAFWPVWSIQTFPFAQEASVEVVDRRRIPSEIGKLTNLKMLPLAGAELTGPIPTEIGLLDSSLTFLDLSGNRFTGTLPSEIGLLTSLTSINLRNNLLTGPIPTEIGLLKNLSDLDLGNNRLEERIPRQIEGLDKLQLLHLDGNDLKGEVHCDLFPRMNNETQDDCRRINYYSPNRGTRMPTGPPTQFVTSVTLITDIPIGDDFIFITGDVEGDEDYDPPVESGVSSASCFGLTISALILVSVMLYWTV